MNDGSGFILVLFMPGLLLAALIGLWCLGRARPIRGFDVAITTSSPKPVSVGPYVLACYVALGLASIVLVVIHLVWRAAPRSLSLSAPLISVFVATWLFATANRRSLLRSGRSLLRSEKWWFTLGCFGAFWIYDAMQSLLQLVMRGNVTAREMVITILGAAFDFIDR